MKKARPVVGLTCQTYNEDGTRCTEPPEFYIRDHEFEVNLALCGKHKDQFMSQSVSVQVLGNIGDKKMDLEYKRARLFEQDREAIGEMLNKWDSSEDN